MSVRGKDGAMYDDVDELMKANARWEQQERQNKLLSEQNRLLEKQSREQAEFEEMRLENEREKMDIERERIEAEHKKIEAIRQAEEDRYINEKLLEQERQEHDKKMRYYNLCDQLNVNYDEIQEFFILLNKGNDDLKYKIENAKKNLEKQNSNVTKNIIEIQNKIKKVKRNISSINRKIKEAEEKPKGLFQKIFQKNNDKEIEALKEESELEIAKNQKQIEELEKEKQQIRQTSIEEAKKIKKQIDDLENEDANYTEALYQDFLEFRINYYNQDAENLLKKLEFNLYDDMLVYDKNVNENRTIRSILRDNCSVDKGTIKDYMNYMQKTIENNDKFNKVEISTNIEKEGTKEIEYDDKDDLLEEAVNLILEAEAASPSFLQRKLHIGYARAGRLIDKMEEIGIISESLGSKPRKVIMKKDEWEEIKDIYI